MDEIINNPLLQIEYFNNSLWDYIYFASITLFLSVVFFFLKHFLFRKISKRLKEQKIFKLFLQVIDKIRSPFYIFVSFYISLSFLIIPDFLSKLFWLTLVFWTTYRVVIIGYQFVDFFLKIYVEKKGSERSSTMIQTLGNIIKGILWIIAGIVLLSLFGVNVTALVAGMGVGGIAVAFALQNILSDLFSSFSIYLDKPFVEGDFIVVGDKWGTVEKIGIKSTRIRSIQGEEIIFSNKELTSAQVHNMKNMKRRRTNFTIGVTYETPTKKMEKIPKIIKGIIEKEELAEFDRVNFSTFNDFSLDYQIVYFINSGDYKMFMEINERIMLDIKRKFEKEEIEFAYPTKTVHLYNSSQS